MKRDFQIFTLDQHTAFCDFINALNKLKRKFTVTPYMNSNNENAGFVVWFCK